MSDPFNQLPTDPAWLRLLDEHTKAAAKEMGCMVVMIAVQEDGKLGLSSEGIPKTGKLKEWADDPPSLLIHLAMVCAAMEEHSKSETRQ